MTKLRLAFMGSPDFAVPTLTELLKRGHEVACVYTQPPRPAGRGSKLRPTAVHAAAEAAGLEVRYPESLKPDAELSAFKALDLDAAVVAAYGLLLPQAILNAPKYGCLNVHASLLPRWRGAAPIQRAIEAGDSKSGVAIMQMVLGLDEGPILAIEETTITEKTTGADLHDRLADIGGPLLAATLEAWCAGGVTPQEQPEQGVLYAAKLRKDEAVIDWSHPAKEIDQRIRAFTPWPGAQTAFAGAPLKILKASPVETGVSDIPPGTILDDQLLVACGAGALRVERLQRAGKKPADAADFLRGTPIEKGQVFG